METKRFELACNLLEKAKVSALCKVVGSEICIVVGMGYPSKVFHKVSKVLTGAGFLSTEYGVMGDQFGGTVVMQKTICGGPQNWDLIKAKKRAKGKYPVTFLRSR